MYKYILKRLVMMIPVLIGISIIIFTIISLTPGNPARLILGERATQEAIDKLNDELGYNDPLPVKYVNYMIDLVQGDMGTSYRTGGSVVSEIAERFPTTLLLAVLDIFLTSVISIPLGVYIAIKKNSIADNVFTIVALIFTAMPSFWLGMLLMLAFAVGLNLLPATGSDSFACFILPAFTIVALIFTAMPSFWLGMLLMLAFAVGLNLLPATGSDSFACFILPAFTVALLSVAQIMRMTRSSMLETLRSDYMRTARAKGVKENKIIWKHAIRNALLPVVTTMGVNFGWALGGSVITETVFGMSGVGTLTLLSVRSKDVPLVMGCVLFMSLLFSVITLIVDISYAFIDPRIKAQYGFKNKTRRKTRRKETSNVQPQS